MDARGARREDGGMAEPSPASLARRVRGLLPALLVLLASLCLAPGAHARGKTERKPPPAGPAPAPSLRDEPTTASVALDDTLSLVLPLGPHFWLQCPRHLPVATTLEGRGQVLQYMNERAGTVSMLYLGCVPLGAALPGDAPTDRASRAASDFVVTLAQKYRRLDWVLVGGPVALAPAKVRLGSRTVAGWRTARTSTHPGEYGGPHSVFAGEGLLFQPPGTDVLAYVFLDAKGGGTTLEAVTARMDVLPTRGLHAGPRRVQLNDLFATADGRFPVRLLAFDLPAGFAPTPALDAVQGEWVLVEERLPVAGGPPDAVLRIAHHPPRAGQDVAAVAREWHELWPADARTPLEQLTLAAGVDRAWLCAHPDPAQGAQARMLSAFWRVDDLVLHLSWSCPGGLAQQEQDLPLLRALLRSLQAAVRW